jgi:DNA-binding transcriptional ArsR family regulator
MRGVPPEPRQLDTRLAKALSHPLRSRLLAAYTGRVASPSQVATELGASIGDVSYHTKRLVEHGCLELVEVVRGRGGAKHFYRAVVPYEVPDADWATLPAELREQVAEPVVASVLDDIANATRDGGLGTEGVHLSRTRLELDQQARDELAALLETLLDRTLRLQEESTSRRRGGKAEEPTALAILHIPARRGPSAA